MKPRALPAGVTRANWRTPPHARWAFRNLDALLPTAPVAAGAPIALARAHVDLSGLRFGDGAGGTTDWAGFLAATHADSMVVLHRGRVAFEWYADGMTAATRHMSFSITKSVLGLLAEMLAADGALDLARPVGELLPELAASAFAPATLRDLLDMRDGVPFDEDYANPDAAIHRYSRGYWGDAPAGVRHALAALTGAGSTPGAFRYRTPVGDIVAWAIERATGEPLSALLSRRLWRPIGAEQDAYLVLDNAGDHVGGTGLCLTTRDLARLGQLLLDDGRVADGSIGGAQVAPPAAIAAIRAGGCRDAFAEAARGDRPGWSYRSLWWHCHDACDSLCALGVFGQRLLARPGSATVIARFGSHPVAANAATDAAHQAAFDALDDLLAGG